MPLLSPKPRKIAVFTARFDNIGDVDEELKVTWQEPIQPGQPPVSVELNFIVGQDVFLEDPTNAVDVPDSQYLGSVSMAAILAGEVVPGTTEYLDAMSSGGTKTYKSIIGNVTLESAIAVEDPVIGDIGRVFDLSFLKSGQNRKILRTDAWSLSQYINRAKTYADAVHCVPPSIHTEFGFKKSDLGLAGSANRQSVIDFVAARKYWV